MRPYGDTTGDGMVQVSFTLPAAARQARRGRRAPARRQDGPGAGAARARQGDGARTSPSSSSTARSPTSSTSREVEVVEREFPLLTSKEVNAAIKKRLRRKLVVVGACIGTDAHTVGIDAILNIKGFAGEKGLEYYREMKVVNLGAQVLVPDLVDTARERRADAVLVSRSSPRRTPTSTTPRRCPRPSARRTRPGTVPLLVVGGPRFEEGSAGALGVDRIFGRGTTPGEVASYLVHQLVASRTQPDPRGAQR